MNLPAPYTLSEPENPTSCAVFSSPHSGAFYPAEFVAGSGLSRLHLRSSEDAFVDQLIDCAPSHGAPTIVATYPRAYVDLNRAKTDLDPALIDGAPLAHNNPCVQAGLGVIPRVVSKGRVIRSGKMNMVEANARLNLCYYPYHNALTALITRQKARFGYCLMFDVHSMPRSAVRPNGFGRRPQIVLGDRFGRSCDRWVIDATYGIFESAGFRVARNTPFAGGFITQRYGKPNRNTHVIQIEIDRSLYMDETLVAPNANFERLSHKMRGVVSELVALGAKTQSIAAE